MSAEAPGNELGLIRSGGQGVMVISFSNEERFRHKFNGNRSEDDDDGGLVGVGFGAELLLSLISWTSGITGWFRAANEVDVDDEEEPRLRLGFESSKTPSALCFGGRPTNTQNF